MEEPAIQKIKGKLKQVEGKVQEATGNTLKGKIKQAEGKAQEEIAELRIQHRKKDRDSLEEESISREETARVKENDLGFDEE